MIRIYFDNELIEETENDAIDRISNDYQIFSESFYLGATPTNTYKISVGKGLITEHPNEVFIYDDNELNAVLVVDNIEEDEIFYNYTLTDRMVNLEFKYDASQIFINDKTTILSIVQDICEKAGITLGDDDFIGKNKVISWYDNTRTARQYIGYIAELNGGYAQIINNKLYFKKHKKESIFTIDIENCSDYEIGYRRYITKVVFELGSIRYVFGNDNGETLYLNNENVFITSEEDVELIYNNIKEFQFYGFTTTNCPINNNVKAGDIITFTDGINNYPTIANYDNHDYAGAWNGGYSLEIESYKQSETKVIGTTERIKNLQIIVDRDTNTITQAIQEIDEQNEKISEVTQKVGELTSKISDIADITTMQETIYATLEFEKINQSEPIYIKIHPISQNISYLYPNNNLYPSNALFSTDRKIRFINTETEEVFEYTLPDDLLISDEDGTYDEFILSYDNQTCEINKKVGYKADGSTYTLTTQRTISYEYPIINLTDGDYKVELVGYDFGYMQVRLMAQNIYTTQFATKAEVRSEINQTANEIDLNVNQKLSNYSTTTEMNSSINIKANEIESQVSTKVGNNEVVSKINQSAESIQINANKVSLQRKNNSINGR